MATIDRTRLREAIAREEQRFVDEHPRSRELFERAQSSLLSGVPMHWMVRWAGAFPVFVRQANGAYFADNALSLAAMRATLEHVLTPEAFARMIPRAERFAAGVEMVIEEFGLPWIVKRLGCRVEYWFRATPPRNGGEAAAAIDSELDHYMHLAALNRGILMTPFHNMALIAPDTTDADVDFHTRVFRESVAALLAD